jgi:ribosome-associated protein
MTNIREVEINKEPVELYKVLKFEGMCSSGAAAKHVVADGQVMVNGEIETRKRKKLVTGDIIKFANDSIRLRLQ